VADQGRETGQYRFSSLLQEMALPLDYEELLTTFYQPFAAWLLTAREQQQEPLVVGLCGAQGSGKSTIAHLIAQVVEQAYGLRTLVLSLDDYYLTIKQRLQLAATVHPLFRTRGVPGTHDTHLGQETLSRVLTQGSDEAVRLPLFDKSEDDRCAVSAWPSFQGRPDIVLFEGWCVGARSQSIKQLQPAINRLEKEQDPQCSWRQTVNKQLAGPYQHWFTMLNKLILLQIPGFSLVQQWRGLQEKKLLESTCSEKEKLYPDHDTLQQFIMHYERLTRWILQEMPQRADLVIAIDRDHNPRWPGN